MKNTIILSIILTFFTYQLSFSQLKIDSEGRTFVRHSLRFGDYTDPYGEERGKWGIEHYEGGLNIWQPWNNAGWSNYKFFIQDQTGNVGIGLSNNNPQTKLHVNGTIGSYPFNGGTSTYLQLQNSAGAKWQFINHTDGRLSIYDADASRYALVVDNSTGNVAIGKYNAHSTRKLSVSGDVDARDVYARGTKLTSDSTLKKDIKKIEKSVEKIQQIKGVSYNWKESNKTDTLENFRKKGAKATRYNEMGVLAQDVERVLPGAVVEDGNGIKYVDYTHLVALMIEAVKEQQTVIEKQEKQIAKIEKAENKEVEQLKAENEQLWQEIEELRQMVETCCANDGTAKPKENNGKKEKVGTATSVDLLEGTAAVLYQNTPNPFSVTTEIKYFLPDDVNHAVINIYNMQGIQLKSFELTGRGESSLQISGESLVAGMYIYSLIADGVEIDSKRMILTD